MPRTTIRRDPSGAKFLELDEHGKPKLVKGKPVERTKLKQGEKNIAVEVTYANGVNISGHEDIIWKTATGKEDLHLSDKVSGQGNLAPIGYIHSYKNTCFLVTRLSTGSHTIQIDKMGKVNGGWHRF